MPAAKRRKRLGAKQHAHLRSMLGAAVIFQIDLWSLRLEISNLFGLGDDDDIDHLLDDVMSTYAAVVPDGQRGLLKPELDELVNDARSAADECWYRR